jgi:hypothetical protein
MDLEVEEVRIWRVKRVTRQMLIDRVDQRKYGVHTTAPNRTIDTLSETELGNCGSAFACFEEVWEYR